MLIIIGANTVNAQFYMTGEPPASLTWKRIETDNFRIVFPEGMYPDANRYANLLEFYKSRSDYLSANKVRKMPVLVHSSSVISNGYVTWTPKRMEIVTTPPQDSYAQDWLSQLSVHEYRHVAQLNGLQKGFNRVLSILTGQIATGISSAMIPAWLYEGDAVFNETRLSNSGRGRMPGFEMPLRTITFENQKPYSYDKSVFGSYKDFVPNHYLYGYHMVRYAQARFGNDIWPGAFEYTGKNMFLISPLAFYLKSNYGISKSQLYTMTMDSIRYQYDKLKEQVIYTNYSNILLRNNKDYTNYTLPRFMDTIHIAAFKTGTDHRDKLVMIDRSGNEKDVITIGVSRGISLSASAKYVVWDEIVRDPRWGRRNYSEIRIFNLATGKVNSLKRNTRYFSPDINANEKFIVAVETDQANRNFLIILDAATGEITKSIPVPFNNALQTPRWAGPDKILAIVVSEKGKRIEEIDLETEVWQTVLPDTWHDIAEPVQYKNYVIFRGTFTSVENIFAVNTRSKSIYQITSSRYGARHPEISPDSSTLAYSDYTAKGFDIVEVSIDTNLWNQVELDQKPEGMWPDENTESESELYSEVPEKQYEDKPYRKVLHLFNFHSWLPFYSDLSVDPVMENFRLAPGLMLFSQNLLGTSILTMGYTFANGAHLIRPVLKWSGWYPVIEISGQYTVADNNSTYIEDPEISGPGLSNSSYELRTYVPLVFTRGKFIKQLQPFMEYHHVNTSYSVDGDTVRGIDYLHFRMFLSFYKRLSRRDLYPRLGSFFSFTYTHTPLNKRQFGDMYSLEGRIYLPGIGKHHHLFFNAGLQKQMIQEYYLPFSRVKFPRGYLASLSKFMGTLAVNYAFPLFYPDFSIESVLYLKRIHTNLFFDYGYGIDIMEHKPEGYVKYTDNYSSFGIELTADFHPLRFIFPVSAGIRAGYMPLRASAFVDFIFSVNTLL